MVLTILGLGVGFLTLMGVGGWLVVKMVFNYLDRQVELATRELDLEERKVATQEQRQRSPAVPKAIPSDLYRRITKWDSPDAQDAERKVLLDLYNEFHDAPDPWVEVRAHLPQEPSDELPAEMFTGLPQT